MGSSSWISTTADRLQCLLYLSSHQPSIASVGLQQCEPDFHRILQTPSVDELPQHLSDSSIDQPSIAPFEFCHQSTFYRIPHATRPLQRTVFRQASTSNKFQTNFSSNRISVGFLQQKVFIRTSTADDFRLQHQRPRHPTTVNPSATSKTSELLLDC